MKSLRTGFILFVFVFSAVATQAQFAAGIKAGMNLSTLAVDDGASDYGYTPGFQVGGFLNYNLTKVDFQLDIVYSQQGASIEANGEELSAVAKYVNIPVVVKYKILPSVSLQLGPQIGFLTCMDSNYHPVTSEPFQEQNYTKAYKKTDFGVNVGAGWESTKGLMVDVRYYLGLTDIADYPGIESTKNRVVQLTVAYKFFKF
jgi:hypothetical protein